MDGLLNWQFLGPVDHQARTTCPPCRALCLLTVYFRLTEAERTVKMKSTQMKTGWFQVFIYLLNYKRLSNPSHALDWNRFERINYANWCFGAHCLFVCYRRHLNGRWKPFMHHKMCSELWNWIAQGNEAEQSVLFCYSFHSLFTFRLDQTWVDNSKPLPCPSISQTRE